MYSEAKSAIRQLIENGELSTQEKLEMICELLRNKFSHYDWVGFYFHEDEEQQLRLKAFAGEPTNHTVIPFGKGICGQVALSDQNFIVPDVMAEDNYLSCGLEVKSEVVIPIFVNGKNIGQIDIDSHMADPFVKDDVELLEFVSAEVAGIL